MVKGLVIRILSTSFALILLCVSVAHAQVRDSNSATQTARARSAVAAERAQLRQDFVKATEEYAASLKTLAEAYEESLKRATEQNAKLKELYTEGIISRREMEASDAAVAEARAKVEEVRKQIEQTGETLAYAAKMPVVEESVELAVEVAGWNARAWTTGNKGIDNLINYYGNKYSVDPYLIYCVMHQESRFGSTATSGKGAMGLMQLMPGTAARYGVTNPYDPAQSIMGGTRYLKDLLALFGGRIDLVLAGYNAGEGAVLKYGNRVPPYSETLAYVRIIGSRYGQAMHATKPVVKLAPAASLDNLAPATF
jgi:soluble lytic murein transglycosylase-like protein